MQAKATSQTTKSSSPPILVAVGLGSNRGDREANLSAALQDLKPTLVSMQVAPLYETEPISGIPQRRFLNTAVVGATHLASDQVLAVFKALEMRAGRVRGPRLGPRSLDLDLLLYGNLCMRHPELTVPHPSLSLRRFVLEPLVRIAPHWQVPPEGASVETLLARLEPRQKVEPRPWSQPNPLAPG